jgi:hypothetical protein
LSLYVTAAINRDSHASSEAGLKYFVLGALSSGMLLYGASLVYGFSGSVAYADIAKAAAGDEIGLGLLFGLVFMIAGLAFKVSAVPFHMWTPDVYEGSPTPMTAFFAAAPKVAAMAVFVRVMHDGFGGAVGHGSRSLSSSPSRPWCWVRSPRLVRKTSSACWLTPRLVTWVMRWLAWPPVPNLVCAALPFIWRSIWS